MQGQERSPAVTEELEVLSSIYGDDFVQLNNSTFTITMPYERQPVVLTISLPSTYPAISPPTLTLPATSLLSGDDEAAVQLSVQQAWQDAAGEVCCYQTVEAVKEIIDERRGHHDGGEAVTAGAATSHAAEDADEDEDKEAETEERDQAVSHYSADEDDQQQLTPEQWQQLKHKHHQPATSTTTPSHLTATAAPFVSGQPYTDRKSVFIAHTTPIHTTTTLTTLTTYLHTHPKLSRATHNITAYRLQASGGYSEEGCDDDGEDKAGGRLLHMLRAMGCVNVWVCVSRWYGGVKLGSDRFRIINNVARQLLEEQGYGERKAAAAGSGSGGGNVKKGGKR